MNFLDNLLKRAREFNSPKSSSADQERQEPQSPGTRPPAAGMRHQDNQALETEQGVKEIRTYRRDGINIIEEYERLNPDGTVTKTISVGDKKDGLKKFEVYKMDKSGIVRRVESSSRGDTIPTETVRDLWMAEFKNMSDNPKVNKEYGHGEVPNSVDSSRNREGNQPTNSQIMEYVNRLTSEQKTAIFNRFKENLLDYGTDKLKHILIPKLDNTDEELGLTDEQKVQLLDHSILRLRKRLSDRVNEEQFFNEVLPRYETCTGEQDSVQDSSQVSFHLQPDSNTNESEFSKNKPVSFVIRPEYGTKSYSESAHQRKNQPEERQYNSISKNVWEDESLRYPQMKEKREPEKTEKNSDDTIGNTLLQLHELVKQHIKENPSSKEEDKRKEEILNLALEKIKHIKNEGVSVQNDDSKKAYIMEDRPLEKSPENTIDNLEKYLKQSTMNDSSTSAEEKEIKIDVINYALNKFRKKLKKNNLFLDEDGSIKRSNNEKTKAREEYPKESDLSDIDEIQDPSSKTLRKLVRKGLISPEQSEEFAKYFKENREGLPKRTRSNPFRDDILHDLQRMLRNDDTYEIPKVKKSMLNGASSDKRMPIDTGKSSYMKSSKSYDDKLSLNGKEKKIFNLDSLLSELKSGASQRKTILSSNDRSKDENKFTNKYRSSSSADSRSETPSKENDNFAMFDLNSLMGKMKELVFGGENASRTSVNENEEENYDDNYFPQSKMVPLELNTKKTEYDSPKQNKPVLDFDSIMSKIRGDLSQTLKRKSDPAPKQVKLSSPYSYQKPTHGTTRISNKNLGNQENEHTFSFRINPQDYSNSSDRSIEKDQINYKKSNDEDFMPWWFGKSANSTSTGNSYTKEPLIEKQPVANSFLGGSTVDDSFFDNFLGNNFSQPQLTDFNLLN